MAFGIACFMIEYQAYIGEEISADPALMRSLSHEQSGISFMPWCFNMTHGTRVCSLRANKVPRLATTVLRLMPSIAKPQDVIILNFGAW